jgi:magnesium chelatase family protein
MKTIQCGGLVGIECKPVAIDATVADQTVSPGLDVVGMPEAAGRELRVRVLAALSASGRALDRRVTLDVHFARRGACLDLACAVAVLTETFAMPEIPRTLYWGELSLAGDVRPVRGTLPFLRMAQALGATRAVVPYGSARYARFVPGLELCEVRTLRDVISGAVEHSTPSPAARLDEPLFAELPGYEEAKALLTRAGALGLNVLMIGSPGTHMTMLARRVCGVRPSMTDTESLEVATIQSASGLDSVLPSGRPFRAPHHTVSTIGLVGGGDPIRAGEVTLAHNGVLYLDELPEFRLDAVTMLAGVLQRGEVTARNKGESTTMPARPMIIASARPCPCGWHGHAERTCSCTPDRISKYLARARMLPFDMIITFRGENATVAVAPVRAAQ